MRELQNGACLLGGCAGDGLHFFGYFFGADLGQLIERSQDQCRRIGESGFLQQAIQNGSIVDANGEFREADFGEQLADDEDDLGIGGDAFGADRVEVALHELAEAAALRVFAAPDAGDVVALERRAEFADVLGGEAGERHGEVEAEADVAAAVVLKAVELLVGFGAAFAEEDFEILEGRRVDRAEAVGAKDAAGRLHDLLARQHGFRQIVAEAFERPGLNSRGRHGES